MEQCQNFSSEHKQQKSDFEMDQTRNQNYSANKICCFSTQENSPFYKTVIQKKRGDEA
jgi:hypothetical protein